MNIIVITGSANRKGTSALLADKFIEGADEAGHEPTWRRRISRRRLMNWARTYS